jgi:hypothetical protein
MTVFSNSINPMQYLVRLARIFRMSSLRSTHLPRWMRVYCKIITVFNDSVWITEVAWSGIMEVLTVMKLTRRVQSVQRLWNVRSTNRGSISSTGKRLFPYLQRLARFQNPFKSIQCTLGIFSIEAKRPGGEDDDSPSSIGVKYGWSYTSTPPHLPMETSSTTDEPIFAYKEAMRILLLRLRTKTYVKRDHIQHERMDLYYNTLTYRPVAKR